MNLQQQIYKKLPQSIKTTIKNNPEDYPEYNFVISKLNSDILSNYKTKVKLTKKDITLMSILLSVYYHITDNPPQKFIGQKNKTASPMIEAWVEFSEKNYPFYEKFIDKTDKWPKFMWLLYYTYMKSYNQYYKIKREYEDYSVLGDIEKYDRKSPFISYIYYVYKYLDKNVGIQEFRDEGY